MVNADSVEYAARHHCLIYEGSPSRHLPVLAAAICAQLKLDYRCLYLNSPQMVAGVASRLAANGLDVAGETERGALVLSSAQHQGSDGCFDTDAMLCSLATALQQALDEGYKGLWASGDMAWEFGPSKDFSALADYERRLERFFCDHPQLVGVCQYHANTLPREALVQGLRTHPCVFINEKLTLVNPHFVPTDRAGASAPSAHIEETELQESGLASSLDRLLQLEFGI